MNKEILSHKKINMTESEFVSNNLKAMESGHSVKTTLHGNISKEKLIEISERLRKRI